jgi:hypothetical protein
MCCQERRLCGRVVAVELGLGQRLQQQQQYEHMGCQTYRLCSGVVVVQLALWRRLQQQQQQQQPECSRRVLTLSHLYAVTTQ